MKVLVSAFNEPDMSLWHEMNADKELKEKIKRGVVEAKAEVAFAENHNDAIREIRDTDILFGYITPEMLTNATKLKWIQAPISSFYYYRFSYGPCYIFPELAESDIILTSTSGIFYDVLSTHVFAFILSLARGFPRYIRNQTKGVWHREEAILLQGKTLGIVGLGSVGKEVARLGIAFGMNIIAVEPNPKEVPQYVRSIWGPRDLKNLLRESDFVVLCLPDAPGTLKLIGVEELKSMKRTAYVINVGRGRTVDIEALTEALKEGKIGGAGLDVFGGPEYEPLPKKHPLWRMDNVIITPHCASNGFPPVRRVELFLQNLNRLMHGERLINVVDKKSMILSSDTLSLR